MFLIRLIKSQFVFIVIAKLSGILDRIYDESLLIDVNGVGYHVLVSKRTISYLPQLSDALVLWTETVMRNEQHHLCGFLEESEAEWFRILTQVQGVGAKVALAILSALDPFMLSEAIISQKSALLSKADGVGPKLASRIILELKDKKNLPTPSKVTSHSSISTAPTLSESEDVISALTNLGYNKNEASIAVSKAIEKIDSPVTIELLLKTALQEFRHGQ